MNVSMTDRIIRNGMMFIDYHNSDMTLREVAKKYDVCKSEVFRRVTAHEETLAVLGIPMQRNAPRDAYRNG